MECSKLNWIFQKMLTEQYKLFGCYSTIISLIESNLSF